jgi:hypothetical protein
LTDIFYITGKGILSRLQPNRNTNEYFMFVRNMYELNIATALNLMRYESRKKVAPSTESSKYQVVYLAMIDTYYIIGKGISSRLQLNRNKNDCFIFVRNMNKRLQAYHLRYEVGNLQCWRDYRFKRSLTKNTSGFRSSVRIQTNLEELYYILVDL